MLSADGLGSSAAFGLPPLPEPVVPLTPTSTTGFVPLEQTFQLSSNPDSNYTIYLDFDGHITADTAWNAIEAPPDGRFGLPFATPPYDIDGDDNVFGQQELLNIQEAYLRVAEDFAPFDVNVTTLQPPLDDLINSGGGDTRWGVRIVSGGLSTDWLIRTVDPGAGSPVGGIALLNSFADPIDTPAFAFAESGYSSGKNLAEVISHEAGHTLGLNHDGNFLEPVNIPIDPEEPPTEPETNEYYPGHENGLWGSIMGAAYTPAVTQWSQGEYYFANNPEDDLFIITDGNGFGYREDDHGDTMGPDSDGRLPSAFEADFENDQLFATGLIEQNTDVDVFQFSAAGGDLEFFALPAELTRFLELPQPEDPEAPPVEPIGDEDDVVSVANLDIKIELYDADGNWLAAAAPDFDLTATLLYEDAPAGDYFLTVTGDGFAANAQDFDLQTRGYTDYGSLGRYSITINGELGTPPDPFEANETIATAYQLPAGDFFTDDLSIHRVGDVDYFAYRPGSSGTLTVSIDFLHALSDLDLRVLNEQEQQVAISAGVTDGETATLPVVGGELYYIEVVAFEGISLDAYSLSVDGPGLLPDEGENDGTTVVTDPLTFDRNLHFAGDVDVYEWQAAIDGQMTADIFFDSTDVDFLVEIVDPSGSVTSSVETGGGQRAGRAVTAGEIYTIRVFSDENSPADRRFGDYQLVIDSGPISGDRLEPNGIENPTIITANVGQFYKISIDTPSDEDYFSFTAPSRGTLEIEAIFVDQFGDLDIRVVDSAGELIGLATSITDNESLVLSLEADENYLIRAYGFEGDIVPLYALLTEFTPATLTPGDFDDNGLVNRADWDMWADSYGMSGDTITGDANGDGVVNAADYTLFRDNEETPILAGGFRSISVPAAISAPAATSSEAAAVESVRDSTDPLLGFAVIEGVPADATVIAPPAPEGTMVSTRSLARAFEPPSTPVPTGDASLLLIGNPIDGDADEVDEDPTRSEDERSRDDAFAELAVAFDRIG